VFFRGSEEAEKCDGKDMGSDSASVNDRGTAEATEMLHVMGDNNKSNSSS
jgi:hypothetical protein